MFSERIRRRKQLWWRSSDTGQTIVDHLKRLEMILVRVDSDAPLSRWKKGEHWQRRLLNKRNSKAFAVKFNCRVPELYWQGHLLTRSVLSSLPEQFVLKPVLGAARKGVYVISGARELLTGRVMTRSQLFDEVASGRGRLSHISLLAEEFIANEQDQQQLPVEYKFYMFGDSIGAINVTHRSAVSDGPSKHLFYTPQWQPFDDPMQTSRGRAAVTDPPACLPRMIDVAVTLGKAFGTFIRVDLYASGKDCVFGEFSSVPYNGHNFTAHADQLFETLWQENFPDES